MKIKQGFTLRTIMGKPIIVAEGAQQVDFNKLISLNDSAALLWRSVENKDFTAEEMAETLVATYNIDRETALNDAADIVNEWVKVGLVEV